jgi:ATPase subunit of ABC transporter with duplicated ATPase domains
LPFFLLLIGCAMIISHDRWFLNRICTHIMAFEGNGIIKLYEGNYADFEADNPNFLQTSAKFTKLQSV